LGAKCVCVMNGGTYNGTFTSGWFSSHSVDDLCTTYNVFCPGTLGYCNKRQHWEWDNYTMICTYSGGDCAYNCTTNVVVTGNIWCCDGIHHL